MVKWVWKRFHSMVTSILCAPNNFSDLSSHSLRKGWSGEEKKKWRMEKEKGKRSGH